MPTIEVIINMFLIGAAIWFFLGEPIARLVWRLYWGVVAMSSRIYSGRAQSGRDPIHVPVRDTHTDGWYGGANETASPDTNAANTDTIAISRRPSDAELIAYLTTIRTEDGRYRLSANSIFACVGGTRADVMARVKELRTGVPEQEPRFIQPDGSIGPATYPVSGRRNGGSS